MQAFSSFREDFLCPTKAWPGQRQDQECPGANSPGTPWSSEGLGMTNKYSSLLCPPQDSVLHGPRWAGVPVTQAVTHSCTWFTGCLPSVPCPHSLLSLDSNPCLRVFFRKIPWTCIRDTQKRTSELSHNSYCFSSNLNCRMLKWFKLRII